MVLTHGGNVMQVVHPICRGIDGHRDFTPQVGQVGLALTEQVTAHHERLIQGGQELMEPFAPYQANIKP
jgi:hypothetical protein